MGATQDAHSANTAEMRKIYGIAVRVLDDFGSFETLDGNIEGMCWTHRGQGWNVRDNRYLPQPFYRCDFWVRTKTDAHRKMRDLLQLSREDIESIPDPTSASSGYGIDPRDPNHPDHPHYRRVA